MPISIGLLDASAQGTRATGVARVHLDDSDAAFRRLVAAECEQLAERPGMQLATSTFVGFEATADVLQVLEDKHLIRAQSIDNAPTDDVVEVPHPAGFAATEPFQDASRAFRAFGLEGLPSFPVTTSDVSGSTAREAQTVGGSSNVLQTEINPHWLVTGWDGAFRLDDDMQEEGAFPLVQRRCCFASGQPTTLVIAKDKQDLNPSGRCRQRNCSQSNHAEDTGIVINAGWAECRALVLIAFVGSGNTSNGPNRQVGREPEAVPNVGVAEALKGVLVGGALLP